MRPLRPAAQLVTIYGGSGFLGRHVVRALAKRGYRIRVAVRRPDLALFLQPLGKVNQIVAVQANLRYPDSVVRAAERSDVVINLVGILQETGSQSFARLQVDGAAEIARAAARQGARMIHVSAIGADENSTSHYARSKAAGEQQVLAAHPAATIMRPSIVFGPEDNFFNRFAALARICPALPLAGGGHLRQVGDDEDLLARREGPELLPHGLGGRPRDTRVHLVEDHGGGVGPQHGRDRQHHP